MWGWGEPGNAFKDSADRPMYAYGDSGLARTSGCSSNAGLRSLMESSSPLGAPKTPILISLRKRIAKTKMCIHHVNGRCTRASQCLFAHSENELRDRPDLYKTRLCPSVIAGMSWCELGDACRYAHNDAELRWTPEFYKTSLCSFWQSGKHCPAGQLCRWAHGAQELRHRKQWQHSRLASIPERQLRDAKTASQIAETTKDATKSALAPFWKLTGKNACQRQRSPTHELGAHTWSPPRVRNERLRHHDAVTKGITAATSILLNAYASPFYGIGTDRLLHASSPPSHFAMQRTAVGVLADNQTFATQLVRTADTARAASPSIPKTFSIERGVRFRSSRPYDPCDDHPLDYRQQEAEDYEWSRMERASFCAGASFRSLGSFVLSGPTGGVQKNTTVCQGSKPRNSVAIALKQEKASSSCCSLASLVTFEALAQDLGTSDETNPSRRPHTVPPRALGRKVSFCEKVMNKSAASVGRSSVRTLEEKENDILRASNPSLLNFWELLTDTAHCSIVSERTTSTVDHAPRLCVQNSCPEYFHQRSSSVGSVCHIDEQPSPSFLETNGGLAHCRFLDQWTKTGLVHVAATGSSAASGSAAAASARLTEV